jgi:hypothetical protein
MFFTTQSNLGGNAAKTKVRSWKKLLGRGKSTLKTADKGTVEDKYKHLVRVQVLDTELSKCEKLRHKSRMNRVQRTTD